MSEKAATTDKGKDEEDSFEQDLLEMLSSEANMPADGPAVFPAEHLKSESTSSHANMPRSISMPVKAGDLNVTALGEQLSALKTWGISALKTNRQRLNERMGRASRTVDTELEARVTTLRSQQSAYYAMLQQSRSLLQSLVGMVSSQRQLADTFNEFATSQPELANDFRANAACQAAIFSNAERLCRGISQFNHTLHTLITQTMEDTLKTARTYDSARLEYDAYRAEFEYLQQSLSETSRVADAKAQYTTARERYEKLKQDLEVKLTFLDDNRLKVVQSQLKYFHAAHCAFFTGNAEALNAALTAPPIATKLPGAPQLNAFLGDSLANGTQ